MAARYRDLPRMLPVEEIQVQKKIIVAIDIKQISRLFRWPQSAREGDSLKAAQKLPPPQKPPQRRRPRDPNVPTAGRLSQATVQLSNASNTAGTAKHLGAI